MTIRVVQGDCREVLATLSDESVHCVVTSPPYWGLRDYGTAQWDGGDPACDHFKLAGGINAQNLGKSAVASAANVERLSVPFRDLCGKCGALRIDSQLGLEPTYQEYVAAMVAVFREVCRVLRKDGTLWLNLGDSYAGGGRSGNPEESPHRKQATNTGSVTGITKNPWPVPNGLKPKDLVGIPWRVAFALQDDGWYLRQDIIWSKPNPMPESVTDRCTKAHEYLFLLTKSARYFYDAGAIAEPSVIGEGAVRNITPGIKGQDSSRNDGDRFGVINDGTRNKRSVWTVATQPYSEAHFATFPPALIEPAILAGCPHKCCAKCGAPWVREVEKVGEWRAQHERLAKHNGDIYRTNPGGGIAGVNVDRKTIDRGFSPSCSCNAGTVPGTVLDPFGGAGTTGLVSDRLQRNAILIELNPRYAEMARNRIVGDAPLFVQAAE